MVESLLSANQHYIKQVECQPALHKTIKPYVGVLTIARTPLNANHRHVYTIQVLQFINHDV